VGGTCDTNGGEEEVYSLLVGKGGKDTTRKTKT
jgi:hypothetical protein